MNTITITPPSSVGETDFLEITDMVMDEATIRVIDQLVPLVLNEAGELAVPNKMSIGGSIKEEGVVYWPFQRLIKCLFIVNYIY